MNIHTYIDLDELNFTDVHDLTLDLKLPHLSSEITSNGYYEITKSAFILLTYTI